MARTSFIKGTIILVAAGLVVRGFGFFYRIYLSNLIGSEGMGLFQLISPVYSLVILTLTAGISIAVSRLVAREYARKHYENLGRITICAFSMVVAAGTAVSVVFYFNIDFITGVVLKDSRTYFSMLFLLPCIPVIAAASALKGYFYGIQDMVPTALSQVVEQIVKISMVMAAAGYVMRLGLEYACAVAVIGMALGEIANLAVVFFIFRSRMKKSKTTRKKRGLMRKRRILGEIIKISVPVSFNRLITSGMGAVEFILIPRMLLAGGMDYTSSIELYGKLTGMAMPLIFFPALVTSSMATTLVPAVSEAVSLKRYRMANYRITRAIQLSFILGFVSTAVFLTFSGMISDIVYRKEDVGDILYLLAFTCVFIYLHQTMLGIMNGLGKQTASLRNSVIGNAIRIAFVVLLIPTYGINSYVAGIIASMVVVCILDLWVVTKSTGMPVDLRNWILKPGIAGVVMVPAGKYIYHFCGIFTGSYDFRVAASVIITVAAGVALMYAAGVLDIRDLLSSAGINKSRKKSKKAV